MWLSKRFNTDEQLLAETAVVTAATDSGIEATASLCSKEVKSFTPYGYCCAVPSGQEILMLSGSDGAVSAGTKMNTPEELSSGEVLIKSLGGATIYLKNDGSVVINGLTITPQGAIINKFGEVIF